MLDVGIPVNTEMSWEAVQSKFEVPVLYRIATAWRLLFEIKKVAKNNVNKKPKRLKGNVFMVFLPTLIMNAFLKRSSREIKTSFQFGN